MVAGLVPEGPGERGGLKEGDVILRLDREEVDTRPALYAALWRHQPGDHLVFEVMRDNRIRHVEIVGADRSEFFGSDGGRPDSAGTAGPER